MISALIRPPGSEESCVAYLEAGSVRIEETDDRVLMVKLHAHFAKEQRHKSRGADGALELEVFEPGTDLYFLSALRELERAGFGIEVLDAAELKERLDRV